MNSKLTGEGADDEVKKSIAIFGYKQWLLSIDMKTKVVQHESKWEIERVWECESERMTFEHRHENKKVFQLFQVFNNIPGSPAFVWRSDF